MTSLNTDLDLVSAMSSLSLEDVPSVKKAEQTKGSSTPKLEWSEETSAIVQLQGRGVYKTNAFSEWFSNGISAFTGLSRAFCFLIEGYMMDDEILERICYPRQDLPDRISLSDVFMKTIPLPFVPEGPPNPEASAMLEGVAKGSMQNLTRVDLGGVLINFATASASQPDVVQRIHMHLGKFITNFAPRLQSLTLQVDFKVALHTSSFGTTQYKFDAACLKKYLPKHANVETMTITLVSAPMTKYVTLDLTNRRLHSEVSTSALGL